MTKEERADINRNIAEKLFGLRILQGVKAIRAAGWEKLAEHYSEVWIRPDGLQAYCPESVDSPDYSGRLSDAWLVVEAMKKRNKNLHLICYAYDRTYASFQDFTDQSMQEANGLTATPEAICRAALKALEKTVTKRDHE